MRIGVVGNRVGWDYNEVSLELIKFGISSRDDIIVSGGAKGVDTYAQMHAQEHGIPILICYPDNEEGDARYFLRNKKIVENSDVILAFNKQMGGGTTQTINLAKKYGKKVYEYKGVK